MAEAKNNASKKEAPKFYPIICSAPGRTGTIVFSITLPDGSYHPYGVELNKAVNVPKWVYSIWYNSEWNENKPKNAAVKKAEGHIQNKD